MRPAGSITTSPTPREARPMRSAAPRDRSMTRRPWSGCRSVTVTTTESPVSRIVTRTREPSGRLGCAAVISAGLNMLPLLVRRPAWWPPYQEACPLCRQPLSPGSAAA